MNTSHSPAPVSPAPVLNAGPAGPLASPGTAGRPAAAIARAQLHLRPLGPLLYRRVGRSSAGASQGGGAAAASRPPAAPNVRPLRIERAGPIEDEEASGQKLQEQQAAIEQAIARAETSAFAAGYAAAQAESNSRENTQQQRFARGLAALEQARSGCLRQLEPEVVALILALAEKVLHHEARLDPLFLADAVRFTLQKLGESLDVVLEVAPAEQAAWQSFVDTLDAGTRSLAVAANPALAPGMCHCHTGGSMLDLSLRAQMDEVARSFESLLDSQAAPGAEWPPAAPPPAAPAGVPPAAPAGVPR